jgi:hypothetical protein
VPAVDDEEEAVHEGARRARPRGSALFGLRVGHAQHATHQLRQASKLPVPLLAGQYLPPPPPPPPAHLWRAGDAAAADRFGAAMVTLLAPWDLDLQRPRFSLSHAGLTEWLASLDLEDVVDRGRRQYYANCIAASKRDPAARLASSLLRKRSAETYADYLARQRREGRGTAEPGEDAAPPRAEQLVLDALRIIDYMRERFESPEGRRSNAQEQQRQLDSFTVRHLGRLLGVPCLPDSDDAHVPQLLGDPAPIPAVLPLNRDHFAAATLNMTPDELGLVGAPECSPPRPR